MTTSRLISLALAVGLGLAACRQDPPNAIVKSVSRTEAIEISRKAAVAKGYDLANYEIDTFGNELSTDGSEWLIGYMRIPGPASPGGHFLVVVNRVTGKATVEPGE